MPVAAIQGAGSPTTPAESCASAVERAGLRQPSMPGALGEHRDDALHATRQREPRPRRKSVPAAQRRDDVAERRAPADAPAPTSPSRGASRRRQSATVSATSSTLTTCTRLGATSRRHQRQAGEPAQHRAAAIGRGREHQRRPQDHPVEIERRQMRVGLRLGAGERGRRRRAAAPIAETWMTRRTPAATQASNSAQVPVDLHAPARRRARRPAARRRSSPPRRCRQAAAARRRRSSAARSRPRSIAHKETAAAPRRSSGRRRSAHGRRDAGAPGSRSRSGRRLRSPGRACRAVVDRSCQNGIRRPGRACRRRRRSPAGASAAPGSTSRNRATRRSRNRRRRRRRRARSSIVSTELKPCSTTSVEYFSTPSLSVYLRVCSWPSR